MSLSKKNLDKLNKYKKNKNLNNDTNNPNNYTKLDHNDNSTKNTNPLKYPSKYFCHFLFCQLFQLILHYLFLK